MAANTIDFNGNQGVQSDKQTNKKSNFENVFQPIVMSMWSWHPRKNMVADELDSNYDIYQGVQSNKQTNKNPPPERISNNCDEHVVVTSSKKHGGRRNWL